MLINTGAPANPAGSAAAAGAGPPKNQAIMSNAALYARLAAARSEQDLVSKLIFPIDFFLLTLLLFGAHLQ